MRFNSRWALALLNAPLHAQCLYIRPGSYWLAPHTSMRASCYLCLISYSSGWIILELGGGDTWMLTNSLRLLFLRGCNPWYSSKVCSTEAQGCDSAFSLAPSSQDPELLHLLSLQPRLPLTLISATNPSMFISIRISREPTTENQQLPLLVPQPSVSGSSHQCTPEISWNACGLRGCPSSRYQGG